MGKRTGPSNYQLQRLIEELTPHARKSRFWKRILADVLKPSRQRREVNLYKIDRYVQEGETVIVPGKVLSVGEVHKKVTVAAITFSAAARRKVTEANGRALSLQELLHENPDGKNVRIMG